METIKTDEITGTDKYVEAELKRRLECIENEMSSDVITCIHPIGPPFDDIIRDMIEDLEDRRPKLLVVLETNGGSIETAERMADVFRKHYPQEVSFLVPNFAMSAGTVLVMSGDQIFMDYYSILGPIDPQIKNKDGTGFIPALGYLERYNDLIAKSATPDGLSQGELAFLIQKFDPGELHRFEQARDHSVDLLKKWLVKYKFKDWLKTRTSGNPVTLEMKEKRAAEIAGILNDTKKWRSHGRGLSIEVLDRELNLIVEDFGKNADLNRRVRAYYRLLSDHMVGKGQNIAIHTRKNFVSL